MLSLDSEALYLFYSGEKIVPRKMSRFLDPFQRWKMGFRDAFFVVILIFFCFSRNSAEALGFVKGMVEWVGSSKSNVFKPRRSYIQMVLSIFSFPSQLLWVGCGVVWELESARARRGRHPQRSTERSGLLIVCSGPPPLA